MDRNEEIRQFVKEGHTHQEASEKFGFSRSRISQIMNPEKYPTKKPKSFDLPRRPTRDVLEKMLDEMDYNRVKQSSKEGWYAN